MIEKIRNDKVVFCGQLGGYQYNDMDDTIQKALCLVKKWIYK